MPNYQPSTIAAIGDIQNGLRVERAAALVTAATVSLFNIFGRVILTGFYGEVMTAVAATATTLQIVVLTTVATAVVTPLSIASADITGVAAGRIFTLPAAVGSVLTISTGSSAAAINLQPKYLLRGPGAVQLIGSAAPATGTIKWVAWYIPVDDGAYLEAA